MNAVESVENLPGLDIESITPKLLYNFLINPDLEIHTIHIGNEQETVIIVDNLLQRPEALVEYAKLGCQFQKDRFLFLLKNDAALQIQSYPV